MRRGPRDVFKPRTIRTVVRQQEDSISIGAVAWATYFVGLSREIRATVAFRPLDSEIDRAAGLGLIEMSAATSLHAFTLTDKGVQLLTLLGIQTEETED